MLLVIHIILALTGLVLATVACFTPSKTKIISAVSLTTLTLGSGTALVIATHSSVMHSCISGLVYLGFVTVELFFAQRRLTSSSTTA